MPPVDGGLPSGSDRARASERVLELPQQVIKARLALRLLPHPADCHIQHGAAVDLARVFETPYRLQGPHHGGHVLDVRDHRTAVLRAVAPVRHLLPEAALRVGQRHRASAIRAQTGTRVTHRLLVPRAHLSPEEAGAVLLAPTVSLSGMFPARLATLGGGGLHVAQVGADGVVLAGLEKVLGVGVKQASIVRRMEGRSQRS
mmetsp:Transcript_18866/g.33682  ORF Transcript_18866/g.33682 Transcript_18866/m.33682 type:complete len:201 (-) Transcript_18866:2523-3125(-)